MLCYNSRQDYFHDRKMLEFQSSWRPEVDLISNSDDQFKETDLFDNVLDETLVTLVDFACFTTLHLNLLQNPNKSTENKK